MTPVDPGVSGDIPGLFALYFRGCHEPVTLLR